MLITVQIQILYFGVLKDIFAREHETLDLAEEATVKDVIHLLQVRASNPQNAMLSSVAVAVNREYAAVSSILRDGDEVALLPPVSGGCQTSGRGA